MILRNIAKIKKKKGQNTMNQIFFLENRKFDRALMFEKREKSNVIDHQNNDKKYHQ